MMQNAGCVIRISKWCCPTCQQLLLELGLIAFKAPDTFLVRGYHSTVSACMLLTWLPEKVVDHMNSVFGVRLRKELQVVTLMAHPELIWNLDGTGLQRLPSIALHWTGSP
jgi:hypothetical protein